MTVLKKDAQQMWPAQGGGHLQEPLFQHPVNSDK